MCIVEGEQLNRNLWNKFLEGDQSAYSMIYENNVQKLFQFGLCFSTDKDLIEDSIHDVFVNIYSKRTNLKPVDNILGYLSISLRNTLLNTLKKNNPNRIKRIDDYNLFEEQYGYHTGNVELEIIKEETDSYQKKRFQVIMESLTVRQREIINYRFVQGLNISEIAVLSDLNAQFVSNITQRSLIRLRECLKKEKEK